MEFGAREGCCLCIDVLYVYVCTCMCVCACVRTCNKQCVHARWRLGGLEHFGDVLFRQRRLPSALSLGVLLLPPLEVLE